MTNDTELPDNILTSPSRASLLGRLSTGEWADVTGPLATTAVGAILGLEKVIVSQGWEVR